MQAPRPGTAGKLLPELRADLQVVDARGGIVVFDPVRQRYHRLDEVAAQLLSLWPSCHSIEELTARANARFGHHLRPEQVEALATSLAQSELVMPREGEQWRRLSAIAHKARPGPLAWAVHNYLYVKVPLVRPQRALERLAPHLDCLYRRTCALLIAGIAALGVYLVSRQWDEFTTTFSSMLSVEGAIIFAIVIAVVKSLHELGHALNAVRYGCRVPAMGVCFMVLVPMLYTDVSDTWRLPSRRQRLAVDAAGLAVELAIAAAATCAWAFLPDGHVRSVAFALATTSWIMSVALNLNPFMRFDGYYILSDLTGIENLQPRAFEIGRWRLRELLLGLGHPPPERLAPRALGWLAIYAWATWLYRLFLFIAIALVVYHIGFKLLGVALFVIEIVYFIAWPIWAELKEWNRMRAAIIKARRGLVVGAAALAAIAVAFVPLSTTVLVPAAIEDRSLAQLFPARAAVVVERAARQGDKVEAGGLILALASPALEHEIRLTGLRLELVQRRLARTPGDRVDRTGLIVLEQSQASLAGKLEGLQRERAELRLLAPVGGTVVEMAPDLKPGRWLGRNEMLARLAGGEGCTVRGYVNEDDVARIDLGARARFVPEIATAGSFDVALESVAAVGTGALDLVELGSHYGGAVAARSINRPGEPRSLVPVSGQFLVSGRVAGDGVACRTDQVGRGTLHATAKPESLAARLWRRVLKIAIRESGL